MKKNSAPAFVKHQTHLMAGDPAPDFMGIDQHGHMIGRASFPGKSIVLYFYPKDNTPTCTNQACSLRDNYALLVKHGYVVIGVSADDAGSHLKFAKKYDLPFLLIADTGMKIIKDYDVWGTKMLFGKIYDGILRTTFVIDAGNRIRQVIHEVDSGDHAQQIIDLEKDFK